MRFRVHTGSTDPLYKQIVDQAQSAFLKGLLVPGEKLPSVRELATQLSVNPTTVVKAYDLLANDRVIVRRPGKGAFVADGNSPLRASKRREIMKGLARELAREGRRLGYSEDEVRDALQAELERLRPKGRRRA